MLYFSPLSVTDDKQRDRKHPFSFPQCRHVFHDHVYDGGEVRLGGALGAGAAGAGGCAWPRWPAAGPLVVFAGWVSARVAARRSLRSQCWLLRPMLLGAGLCGAGRARAAAGAAACTSPGRAARVACAGVYAVPARAGWGRVYVGATLQGFGRARRQRVSGAEDAG
jgi:hypothetical protein